jgi:predicted Rossmann fold flavoprotein
VPDCDVLIIGAGAAGLFCAAIAGARGRSVVVLDHADKPGKKILISGGGRCNFTNRHAGPANYLSQNPHFCRSALARYRPEDFITLVESHRLPYEERRHGQLFCTGSAQGIVSMLTSECERAGVTISLGTRIGRIEHAERFTVNTSTQTWTCASLVVATGGLSIPTIGASDLGHRLAAQFGHALVPTAPALAPLLLPPAERLDDLSGIAVDAAVTAAGPAFR